MDQSNLKNRILAVVREYVAKPEAWEEAQLVIDPVAEEVDLMEIEETDRLPDNIDVYAVMDFIEMTPDGRWKPDAEAIAEVVEGIMDVPVSD